ncbi:MAG TPA: pilus assembly protein TadG-related protein [Chloroflexota bacterium]|jgi:Flp pilus assembly protein TadG
MQLKKFSFRQQGQVAIIMAVALTALLGATGAAIDLGFGYAHRRQVQNAADSAAVAGAMALGRHIVYTYDGSSVGGVTLTDYTDAMILNEITLAAASSIPPYNAPSTSPSWPTGGTNALTAYYMTAENTPGAQVGSLGGAPPAAAVGIRVQPALEYSTMVAKILGNCCRTMTITASARAMLRPLASYTGAPFIVCGGSSTDGSFLSASTGGASPPAPGQAYHILDMTANPPQINPNFVSPVGGTREYLIESSQIGSNSADCEAGSGFHGNADQDSQCTPQNPPDAIPCSLPGSTGVQAGPIRNLVAGLPGCNAGDSANNCVIILPVADTSTGSGSNAVFSIVAWAPYLVVEGSNGSAALGGFCNNNNCHTGKLLGAAMMNGQAGSGVINPNNPSTFVTQLVPE